jgi:hypothetical protein
LKLPYNLKDIFVSDLYLNKFKYHTVIFSYLSEKFNYGGQRRTISFLKACFERFTKNEKQAFSNKNMFIFMQTIREIYADNLFVNPYFKRKFIKIEF